MGVSFKNAEVQTQKRRTNGNTRPLTLMPPLDQPGRLRKGHLMVLLGIGSTTLRNRLQDGQVPPPDGHDGYVGRWLRPFWLTTTMKAYLESGGGDAP
jgi:hypothetical protein